MIVYMNFQGDYEALIAARLPKAGVKNISKLSFGQQFDLLHDNSMRKVPEKRYTVHMSRELKDKLESTPSRNEVLEIVDRLKNGQSVNPFLSKRVAKAKSPDLLLRHWEINHLHPVPYGPLDKDGFTKARSNELLFFRVKEDVAYLIDVLPHPPKGNTVEWANSDLVKVVDNNWPELHCLLSSDTSADEALSDSEIATLRGKHANCFVTTSRGQVNPGLGVTHSGASVASVVASDYTAWLLPRVQDVMRANYEKLRPDSQTYVSWIWLVKEQKDGWLACDGATGQLFYIPNSLVL